MRDRLGRSFEEYLETLRGDTPKVLLQLTEARNLDCRYCVCSDAFSAMRPHGGGQMSKAVLKRAVDLFVEQNRRLCCICFIDAVGPDGGFVDAIPGERCGALREATLTGMKLYCDKVRNGTFPGPGRHGHEEGAE